MSTIDERLVPLANVARDLSDEDLQECVIFAAYLTYRRRVFHMASTISSPTKRAADRFCTCSYSQYPLKNGKCPNCGLPRNTRR